MPRDLLDGLTPREFQVMQLVIMGCSINKLALSSEWRKGRSKPIAPMLCRSWGSLPYLSLWAW